MLSAVPGRDLDSGQEGLLKGVGAMNREGRCDCVHLAVLRITVGWGIEAAGVTVWGH